MNVQWLKVNTHNNKVRTCKQFYTVVVIWIFKCKYTLTIRESSKTVVHKIHLVITLLVMIHTITSCQGHLQNKNLLDKQTHVEKNMRTYDTLHRSETHSFWYKQCWWWNKREKTWYIEEVQVCLYMLSQKKLNAMWLCNISEKEL